MISGPEVEAKLHHFAETVFTASLPAYLQNAKRSLFGLVGDPTTRQYGILFGTPPQALLTAASTRFVDAKAGYRVDAGKAFALTPPIFADVFVISGDLLATAEPEVDTIIIHELCHWVIDGRPIAKAGLALNEKDEYHGGKLYARTDSENENRTRHTREFCNLLSGAARVLATQTKSFQDRWSVIESAMRFDLRP